MLQIAFRLHITSPLPADLGHIPFAPELDFSALITAAGASGALDPNSIEIYAGHRRIEYALGDDLLYGERGTLEWALADAGCRDFEVRFSVADRRPPLAVRERVPLVGIGDLLRYNAGVPRPIALGGSGRLVDLTGDGRADLVGCWNYYHRPGTPISGVVCFPRRDGAMQYGDMARLRYVEPKGAEDLHHFPGTYVHADFADVDGDGLCDLVFADQRDGSVGFFLNTGKRDGGGWPIFVRDQVVAVPFAKIDDLQLVDVDGDGALDLVVNGHCIRNENAAGWPVVPADPVDLGAGAAPALLDLDGTGTLALVQLEQAEGAPFARRLLWRPQEEPLTFGAAGDLGLIGPEDCCSWVRAVCDGNRQGLLLQCAAYQELRFYPLEGPRRFGTPQRLESLAAVAAWSDQAWPCLCDWNGDGVQDLLIGGGYGWPRIVRNEGSDQRPAWAEPELLFSEGAPIRVLRDDLLHSCHWHNMGYPYPVYADWDGDGLPDLLLPNETNRIVWYRNIGTRDKPAFGPRQFLAVDGFADSEQARAASGRLCAEENVPNQPYPRDPRAPFFWRIGAAFADWNGDGLLDLIAHSHERRATLFEQYIAGDGARRLRMAGPVRLEDGRQIDDSIVGRDKHWTESFRAVDWDGNGLIDLIYNLAGSGEIYLLRNVGTKQAPLFAEPRQMACYGEPIAFTIHGPNAWPGDYNGDGKPDLLGCVEWSVYPFYAHAALEMAEHPRYEIGDVRILD